MLKPGTLLKVAMNEYRCFDFLAVLLKFEEVNPTTKETRFYPFNVFTLSDDFESKTYWINEREFEVF